MEVNLVVVLFRHVARHKALILQKVRFHHTCLDSLLYLVVQLFYAADADFFAVL